MTRRVLVVEDHRPLAENLAELFREPDVHVTLSTTAAGAVTEAAAHGFDLAVVDVGLAGNVSGLDLVPRLRAVWPDGEIVLVTGNATLDTALAAVREGVFGFIQKPFNPTELRALGERALTQVRLRAERAALAKELGRSEALHRAVVDTVSALIVGVARDGSVAFCNQYAAQVAGRPAELIRGVAFSTFAVAAEDRRVLERALQLAFAGAPMPERQFALRTVDGEKRLVRWTLAPLPTGESEPLVLAVGTDVTERIDLERRTAQSEAMAVLGTLSAGLAHEIRNPLNAASLQLELLTRSARRLEDQKARESIAERAHVVREELSRLSHLLEDFLSLTRPRELHSAPFRMAALVEDVRTFLQPLASQAKVELRVEIPETLEALADRARVHQILVNLVVNALDAMRQQGEGTVTIMARPAEDGMLEVSVSDTGPGLDATVRDTLFAPFVTTKEAGTGLGLTIVKKLVEVHGGTIDVADAASGGVTARFTLPSP